MSKRISYVVCVGKNKGVKVYTSINSITDGEIRIDTN